MKNILKHITLVIIILSLVSCKTTKYITVPVETVKTEYITKKDSIYIHDSIDTYKELKGDTLYVNKIKYRTQVIVKTDTVIKTDSIPVTVEIPKIVEVNKIEVWQKVLMYTGGVGILLLIGMLLYKFKIWKLLF